MKQRIYIDTSVIGGYHDKEFKEDTRRFFDGIISKDFFAYLSEISQLELIKAPERVKNVVNTIPSDCLFFLQLTDEAKVLAEQYLSEAVLRQTSRNDAYHISIATTNRLDVLSELELQAYCKS